MYKYLVFTLLIAIFLCGCGSSETEVQTTVQTGVEQSQLAISTSTPEATPTSPPIKGIPGFDVSNFIEALESDGYVCEKRGGRQKLPAGTLSYFACWNYADNLNRNVAIYWIEEEPDDILIEGMIIDPNGEPFTPGSELSSTFFGQLANISYDGATPYLAQKWVEDILPLIADGSSYFEATTFSGVNFFFRFNVGSYYSLHLFIGDCSILSICP